MEMAQATSQEVAVIGGAPAERTLREIFALRDRYVRRGDYQLLGRLLFFHTVEAKGVDYGKVGPAIAMLTEAAGDQAGALVVLDPWQGLPDIVRPQATGELLPEGGRALCADDLCDSCRTTCTDCGGTGHRLCTHKDCGGLGYLETNPIAGPGLRRRWLRLMHRLKAQKCPECHGQKLHGRSVRPCIRCQGSGQMPTGRKDRKPESIGLSMPEELLCPECRGNGRKLEHLPQSWVRYVAGQLEEYFALGPIASMMLRNLPGDPGGFVAINFSTDAEGNHPVICLADPKLYGQSMYIFGGRARIVRPGQTIS